MKHHTLLLLTLCLLSACAGQQSRILIRPDPALEQEREPVDPFDSWLIIESQNGQGDSGIPEWVRLHFNDKFRGIESLDEFNGKYVFAGENRGDSFHALHQWANAFAAEHDLPRLIAARVENRMVESASLYPDDEYGQFFENLIKSIADGEFPGAAKGETFWLKRQMIFIDEESAVDGNPPQETIMEIFIFVIQISIDRAVLQNQLNEIISGIRTATAPTRAQAARISSVQQNFFEGF